MKFRYGLGDIEDLAFWWVFWGYPAKPDAEYVWPTDGGSYGSRFLVNFLGVFTSQDYKPHV